MQRGLIILQNHKLKTTMTKLVAIKGRLRKKVTSIATGPDKNWVVFLQETVV